MTTRQKLDWACQQVQLDDAEPAEPLFAYYGHEQEVIDALQKLNNPAEPHYPTLLEVVMRERLEGRKS